MRLTARNQERGSVAAEFAILTPILALILTGLIQVGTLVQTGVIVHNAAREGARYAAVESTNPLPVDAAVAYLATALVGRTDVTISSANVSVSGGGAVGSPVTVNVQLPVAIGIPLMQSVLDGSTVILSGAATMEVTQ